MDFDVRHARSLFPAMDAEWALFDNAGGSLTPALVLDRISEYLRTCGVQLGATYDRSRESSARVEAGRAAMARWVGARPEETILGPSTTLNFRLLADALAGLLEPGDEVIVTDLDHESNIGPWRALERVGARIVEWPFHPDTLDLELEDLEARLTARTRVVCVSHCSNLIGMIQDVPAITALAREAGAISVVDGVAHAPHRPVDVAQLGADVYGLSLYKTFGPHVGLMVVRQALLERLPNQNHFFVGESARPAKLEPGNPAYELAASLVGVEEYWQQLARHHEGEDSPAAIQRTWQRSQAQESRLARDLLEFLDREPRVRLFGSASSEDPRRVPTISFVVDGVDSREVTAHLDRHRVATRHGHFHAYRLVERLGLDPQDGVVRVSLLHTNTQEEVARLIQGLEALLA